MVWNLNCEEVATSTADCWKACRASQSTKPMDGASASPTTIGAMRQVRFMKNVACDWVAASRNIHLAKQKSTACLSPVLSVFIPVFWKELLESKPAPESGLIPP